MYFIVINTYTNIISKYSKMKMIKFINETDLPIIIETWADTGIYGLSTFIKINVSPMEDVILYEKDEHDKNQCLYTNCSLTGEWIINSLYCIHEKEYQIWKDKGYRVMENIGKFRSESCILGNNTWTNTDLFELNYLKKSNTENFSGDIISFSKKNM
jgi:hypothetical protein